MDTKTRKIMAREGLIVVMLLSMFATVSLSNEAGESKKSYFQTRKVVCPKCSQIIDAKVSDPVDTVYTCKKCGYKFSKTDGIEAFKKLLLNASDIETLQDH